MVDVDPLSVLEPIDADHEGSRANAAYELLRTAILEGALPGGTRIVEEALAQRISMSRAPLRDALARLKSDGLLVDESARTTRVVTITAEAIEELHLIRTLLETAAYQRAARQLTSEDVEELQRIIDEMRLAQERDDRRGVADLDYLFHRRLCEASRLPRLVAIWDEQHVLFSLWLNLVGHTLSAGVEDIVNAHQMILDAVTRGDADEIFEHVACHVYLVADALGMERRRWAAQQPRVTKPIGDLGPVIERVFSQQAVTP